MCLVGGMLMAWVLERLLFVMLALELVLELGWRGGWDWNWTRATSGLV